MAEAEVAPPAIIKSDADKVHSNVMLFNRWTYDDIQVSALSVEGYITATASKHPTFIPRTAGREGERKRYKLTPPPPPRNPPPKPPPPSSPPVELKIAIKVIQSAHPHLPPDTISVLDKLRTSPSSTSTSTHSYSNATVENVASLTVDSTTLHQN